MISPFILEKIIIITIITLIVFMGIIVGRWINKFNKNIEQKVKDFEERIK